MPNIISLVMDAISLNFAKSLYDDTFVLSDYLLQIQDHITILHHDTNVLKYVCKFLKLSGNYLHIADGIQSIETITFGELLIEIGKENYHNKDDFKCKYHEESLLTHSICAMLKCIEIMPLTLPIRYRSQLAICALFHDVGKISCCQHIKKTKGGMTSFAFHGECGSGIMMQLWTSNLESLFTKFEWEIMCRTIAVHMCGYHCKDYTCNDTKYKMELLTFEDSVVKENLYWLCYGDSTGKISKYNEDIKMIMDNRENFRECMQVPFSYKSFTINRNITGCLIKLCGQSGTGKSSLSKLINKFLLSKDVKPNMIINIERDLIMCNVSQLNMDKMAEPFTEKPDGAQYKILYRNYKDKNLRADVDSTIMNIIKCNCNKIVIVDTLMNYHNSAATIYPDECKYMFKININVLRGKLYDIVTCARMENTLGEQLDITGNISLTHWLPKGAQYNSITSMSTNSYIRGHAIQPHMCFQYHWTPGYSLGVGNIKRMLQHVIDNINYNPDLCEYINNFEDSTVMTEYFRHNKYLINYPHVFDQTLFRKKCFMIKYLEHNRSYSKQWMRSTRGSIFIDIDGKHVCIKNLLQRGIEYVTNIHVKEGITVNENSGGMYDDVQDMIIRKFTNSESLESVISFKNDGSLLGITLYPKSDEKLSYVMEQGLNNCPISKVFMEKATKYGFIPCLSSQGTLTISMQMADYYFTSIAMSLLNMSFDDIQDLIGEGMTVTEFFEDHIADELLRRLDTFWQSTSVLSERTMCLSFECVCKQRCSAWNTVHTELAVSYDESSFKMLGCTFNVGENVGTYRAHFQLGSLISDAEFMEPLFWKCNHTNTVSDMIATLSNMLQGTVTEEEFYGMYPYSNICGNVNRVVDYEGFVIYVKSGDQKLGIGIDDYNIDYGKAKTVEYYKCHKKNTNNINYLMSLPESASKHLPLIRTVKEFYNGLEDRLVVACSNVFLLLQECIAHEHDLYTYQTLLSTQHKMINAFNKMTDVNIQCMIIINTFKNYDKYVHDIFTEQFKIVDDDDKIRSLYKKIITTVEPWNGKHYDKVLNDSVLMDMLFDAINKIVH